MHTTATNTQDFLFFQHPKKIKNKKNTTNTSIVSFATASSAVYASYLYYHPDSKIYAYRKFAELLKLRSESLSISDLFANSSGKDSQKLKGIGEQGSSLYKSLNEFTNSAGRLKMASELKQIYDKPESLLVNELKNKSSIPIMIEKIFKNFEDKCPVPEMIARAQFATKEIKALSSKISADMKKMAVSKGIMTGLSIFSLLLTMKHALKTWKSEDLLDKK